MKPHSRFIEPSRRPSPKGRGRNRGSGLVIALVTLLVVTSIMGSIMHALLTELRQTRQTMNEVQAQWLADAAVERAAARLSANSNYQGENWNVNFPISSGTAESHGTAEIKVERSGDEKPARIIVHANYPDDSRRRVSAERTVSVSYPKINPPASDSRKETDP
jgi:Tfp pilus assembly protein PilV